MTRQERSFLNDVLEAVDDWEVTYSTYHEDGYFCVDIDFDDCDEWGEYYDDIWDALSEVCDNWDAGIDSWETHYELAVQL